MFLHNIAVQERNIAADAVIAYDLPVNPLSVILICLRPLNDTGTLANFASYRDIAAAMNRVSVLYRGEAIVSCRGEDLAALNYYRWGIQPFQGQHKNVNNERRCAVVPILMGRYPYDKNSVFPKTMRGELTLEIDFDIADTGYDTLNLSVETVEILDASPREYEKKVQVTQTNGATGDQDLNLFAGGNLVRGMLLFGTTGFTGATPAPSWGRVKVLLDGQETGYGATDFETLQGMHGLKGIQPPTYDAHKHIVTTDGNAQTELATLAGVYQIGLGYEQYAFMDFDPTGDDAHSLNTAGKSVVQLRANVETADAVRVLPIEVIKL